MAQTLDTGVTASAPAARDGASGRPAPRAVPLAVWATALLGGALFAAAIVLWMRNGVSVFFDTLTAGIGSCL